MFLKTNITDISGYKTTASVACLKGFFACLLDFGLRFNISSIKPATRQEIIEHG